MDIVELDVIKNLARQESAKLHHYFIGVEHLFIALTQLRGGVTSTALQTLGISPRFVRYSLRESLGTYEDRRYWAGFPETPRFRAVLGLASRIAPGEVPNERDLLLAILEEGDSIVVRVMRQIGVDIQALHETVQNWSLPVSVQLPDVPIEGQIGLDAQERRILQLMFREYGRVQVLRELAGGYSGARVFLVRPVRVDGNRDAPVVVKLDDRFSVLYERRRYDLYVKGTLPASTARLVDTPVVPDDLPIGGLKYTFVGGFEDTEPISLREYATQQDPEALADLLRALFKLFSPAWWLQSKPYRFGMWREYEHALPPALVVEALPVQDSSRVRHVLAPLAAWSRRQDVLAGETVALQGFVVQKIDVEKDVLYLAAGSQPEAFNRASKVEVRGLGVRDRSHYRGEMIAEIVGRVVRTRHDLLLRGEQDLEPDFDPLARYIPSPLPALGSMPNPLYAIPGMLERQITGHVSTIHGDLHLGNILVGPRRDAWLIDFEWARDGHTLFDWALLEVSYLVEVLALMGGTGWNSMWEIIAQIHLLNLGDNSVTVGPSPVARGLAVVRTLREIVGQCLGREDRWEEYFAALALVALRVLEWRSATLDGRRLGYLVSALSLAELENQRRGSGATDVTWSDVTTTDLDRTETNLDQDS